MEKDIASSSGETKVGSKIFYIEVLRVISCIAVILLHSITGIVENTAIYDTKTWYLSVFINSITRFAVPVFFMICGYLALKSKKESSIKEYLKNRFLKLVIPLITYSLVYYIVHCIVNKTIFSVCDFLFKFITMDIQYHLWFMYTLISIELFVPLFRIIIQNASRDKIWYLFFIIILPTTILTAVNKFSGVWIFRFEPVILGYVGYYILGYLLGTADIAKSKRIFIYIAGIVTIAISYFGAIHFSSEEGFDAFFNGGYQFNSYIIATAIFIFAKYNFKPLKNDFINNTVIQLGGLAFGIYLIHPLILNTLIRITPSGHIISLVLLVIPAYIMSAIITYAIKFITNVYDTHGDAN